MLLENEASEPVGHFAALLANREVLTVEAGHDVKALGMTPHVPPARPAIYKVAEAGWAEEVGIRAGYLIQSINGNAADTMSKADFVNALKGRPLRLELRPPPGKEDGVEVDESESEDDDDDEDEVHEELVVPKLDARKSFTERRESNPDIFPMSPRSLSLSPRSLGVSPSPGTTPRSPDFTDLSQKLFPCIEDMEEAQDESTANTTPRRSPDISDAEEAIQAEYDVFDHFKAESVAGSAEMAEAEEQSAAQLATAQQSAAQLATAALATALALEDDDSRADSTADVLRSFRASGILTDLPDLASPTKKKQIGLLDDDSVDNDDSQGFSDAERPLLNDAEAEPCDVEDTF